MTRTESATEAVATPPSVAVSIDGCIAENKLCVECGYNLRGLKTDGRCSECGTEVAASLRGHDLHASSLPWLREVCRGFSLMRFAILVPLIGVAVFIAIEMIWTLVGSDRPTLFNITRIAFGALIIAMAAVALHGFFLATRAEPRVAALGEGFSPRRRARAILLFSLALWCLIRLIGALSSSRSWADQFMAWAPLVLALAGPAAAAAFLEYIINLLDRTADEKTRKTAKQSRQSALLAIALATLVLVVRALAPVLKTAGGFGERLTQISDTASGCNMLILALFAIGMLELIWRTSNTMKRTLATAEEDNHRHSSPTQSPFPPSSPVPPGESPPG